MTTATAAAPRWLALESNPEVLTKYVHKLGASKEWGLVDVFGLDDKLLAFIPRPVGALLLLFPAREGVSAGPAAAGGAADASDSNTESKPKVFFMKQTIENACGTIGLLHSLANSKAPITEASPLDTFLKAASDKSPEEKAKLLEENDAIRKINDEFARQGQTATPNLEDNVDLHFVSIVLVDGHIFELDGRKAAPVQYGVSSEETFLKDAAAVCKKYMSSAPDAINFSLLALVKM